MSFQAFLSKTVLKYLIFSVVLLILGIVFYSSRSSNEKIPTFKVAKGLIVDDVLANGKVESITSASFAFKSPGKVTKVAVKAGDNVLLGQELLFQETDSLDSQIAEMDAAIRVQQARLAQLRAGSSLEEIDVVEASADSASTAFENAKTNSQVTRQSAIDSLTSAYTTADDVIHNKVDKLFTNARSKDPKLIFSPSADFKLGNTLESGRPDIETELASWNQELKTLTLSSDLSGAITKARSHIEVIKRYVELCSSLVSNASNIPPSSFQVTWDSLKIEVALGKASLNNSLTSLTSAQAALSQTTSQVDLAKSSLSTVQKQLQQAKASARGTDVAVYQAQLDQARAAKKKVESQRSDLVVTAPFAGIVTDVSIKPGEVAGPTKTVLSLLSYDKLQVKVNIVENNIVNVRVGQMAKLTFDAMVTKEYQGKVIAIDPAQKEINGAVYYQATVELTETVPFLRPGMTANVWVICQEFPDSLYVPVSALVKKDAQWVVTKSTSLGNVEIPVTPGIRDRRGFVQILSGVSEGDVVVLDPTYEE